MKITPSDCADTSPETKLDRVLNMLTVALLPLPSIQRQIAINVQRVLLYPAIWHIATVCTETTDDDGTALWVELPLMGIAAASFIVRISIENRVYCLWQNMQQFDAVYENAIALGLASATKKQQTAQCIQALVDGPNATDA